MLRSMREPGSALTHLLGVVLSVIGLILLIDRAASRGTVWHVVSFAVFGGSLVALYTASTLYHGLPVGPRGVRILRRVDHMMIFLLIAGTYTPFCLGPLRGVWGWSLFGVIWGLATVGMGVKLLWLEAPRWLTTLVYVIMGWLVLIAIYPLAQAVSAMSLIWLVAGGVLYTVGALCYALKWPDPFPGRFGFHEVWHLFVMAGSAAHVLAVASLL